MIYLIAAALALILAAIVAWFIRLFLRPDEPEPVDDRPLLAPASEFDARPPAGPTPARSSVEADTEVFWPSRHHEDTVEFVAADYRPPLYSPAFAAAMGYDQPGRESGR
ncbi:hypothetical protein ACIBJE_02285 [Micromonospora sp. NPDC050187]|uniref:hypothetical protein n=1 Tax=Micromonospora sp. NPDC050187 TaxID=3364277 RepID=UPI0037B3AE7F